MRKNIFLFKYTFVSLLVILIASGMQSCKKKEADPAPMPVYSSSAPDAVIFEHSGTKPLQVTVQSNELKEFVASLSGMNLAFSAGNQKPIILSNESAPINIQFNQLGVTPGSYPCQLTVSVANENHIPQTKTVQLVYAPNCAYNFRNHVNGEITYQINGNLENKTISCSYNEEGQLVVNGLTTYSVILNFDCDAQTATMIPLTHLGVSKTAYGQIQGQYIDLQMYDNGNLNAVARIKP